MAKVYTRGPVAHKTSIYGAVTRARKQHKVVTAKKRREQNARTEQVKESRAMRKMLREKPTLRGWLHLIAFPFSVATSVLRIVLAPSGWRKAGVSVYGATIMLLFGVSAALHLGHGHFPRLVDEVLCRIDYSNIFLVIAGTCTPFLFALDNWPVCWTYIGIVWITAIVGTLVHIVYTVVLHWLFTIVLLFWKSPYIGPVPTILVIAGGACYIAGAVCFALRKPNPVPKWFEFHELFHLGTIGGYVCHVIALFLTVLAMR